MRTLLNLASRINKSNNQINVNFQKKKLPERFFKDFEHTKKEIRKFADEMLKDYDKDSLIKEFCTIAEYANDKLEFVQVGQRVNLPKEFFEKEEGVDKDNSVIASDFIRSLVNGEKDFILKEILSSADLIKQTKINSFNLTELEVALSKLNEATDIFFPIERFHNRLSSFLYDSNNKLKIIFGKENPILEIGGKRLNIHWILSDSQINKIIVTNKEKLQVIQKKFEDANKIKDFTPIGDFKNLSENKKLMLYLAEKDKENFDFIFRTILSKPKIKENSALIIEVGE